MHPNAIHSQLAAALAETEARLVARLDALEARLVGRLERTGPASPADAGDATPQPRKASQS